MRITTNSVAETKRLGYLSIEAIARVKEKISHKESFVIILGGDLGGGKTSFLQGLARGLKIKRRILSPTFIIFRKYKIKRLDFPFRFFYHFDCYRLEEGEKNNALGLSEILDNGENIIALEWGNKIKRLLPSPKIKIHFNFSDINKREIVFSGSPLILKELLFLWKKK